MTEPDEAPVLLACGRDPVALWDAAQEGALDEHARTCPHCQVALAEGDLVSAAGRALREEPLDAPPAVLGGVMGVVQADLRPGRRLPLPTPGGRSVLTEVALGNAVRLLVDEVDGLLALRVRLAVGGDGAVALRVTVSAAYGTALPEACARAQALLVERVPTALGIAVGAADVVVADMHVEDLA